MSFLRILPAVLFLAAALKLPAQGTAFSYQGRLYDSGSPANTNYDFRFAVYDGVTNGTRIGGFVTNAAVPVSNGLFSVVLNFGPVFNGTDNGSNDFLDIAVRATNVTTFTILAPRQPVLPVPYATFATSASNLLGTLPSAVFSGSYSNAVNFPNTTNAFTGTFSGNGSNLVSLNAANISSGTLADARLSPNVARLNAGQTFTGSNNFTGGTALSGGTTLTGPNAIAGPTTVTGAGTFSGNNFFSGVNTFTNLGNSFSGSFFGNGLVGWIPTASTSIQAQFDHGYLLTSAALVTVTLPQNGNISVGDIVRIAGGGSGGWLVKVNSGQSIIGNFATYANGTLATRDTANYHGVAASADGTRLYAVGTSILGVEASSDSGRGLTVIGMPANNFSTVACSANGKIVYAQTTAGVIWQSTNSGITWPTSSSGTAGNFISCTASGTLIQGNVACSGDGTYRAKLSGGVITISANSGSSFNIGVVAPSGANNLSCLGTSSDCTRLVTGSSNGLLYASSDQGQHWTTLTTTNQSWSGAWMSPDGGKFAATVSDNGSGASSVNFSAVSALPNTGTSAYPNGSICGSQGSAVELQYVATGVFMPVSSTGLIWAN